VVFTSITVRVSLNLSYFSTCFFAWMMANFEQLRMNNMQRTSAIVFLNCLVQAWFSPPSLSGSASILFFSTCFFAWMMTIFDINVYIIARENLFHPCKIGRAPYGVRLISYNAVRYVTTKEKILKNRPVPGRLSNSPVMCKSLKSYDVSFICDHSITQASFCRQGLTSILFCRVVG